jgi:Ion transport protein
LRKWVDIIGPYIPDKPFKTIWDFLILVFTYYQLVMIPIEISFDIKLDQSISSLDKVVTICFITDIILTFNTAIFVRGLQIRHRKDIALHYLKFWFWVDLIASFPYEIVFPEESSENYFNLIYSNQSYATFFTYFRFFQVVRLIRILKLRKLFNHLENFLDLNNTMTNIFGFVKLSLYVFIVAHWISCYFHFEGFSESAVETVTWLSYYGITDDPWQNRYLASFYFGIATMQTVGFGDIIPVTTKERIITIIAMMIACGMFGYTMNKIHLIISGLDNTTDHFK